MPRESTDEDESKYSGISSNNEGIISRLKSSISSKSKKDRKVELMKENSSIKVRKVRNIEKMNSPETELPMRNTTPMMEGEALQLRRSLEYELIARCDKDKIDSRTECWYIMDCSWLDDWTSFIDGKTSIPPSPISTIYLINQENKKNNRNNNIQSESKSDESIGMNSSSSNSITSSSSGSSSINNSNNKRNKKENVVLRNNLEAKVDYRCVPPLVYFVLREIYGSDGSPEICRYIVDIYSKPVSDIDRVRIQHKPMTDARIKVNMIRQLMMPDKEDDDENVTSCCCGLKKEHLEAFIYWMVRCCSRNSSGRKDIRYRDYNPLPKTGSKNDKSKEDEDHQGKRIIRSADDDSETTHLDENAQLSLMGTSNPERSYSGNAQWLKKLFLGEF